MAINSDDNGEAGETVKESRADASSSSSGDNVVHLISKKMIFGRNLSIAWVPSSGNEGCVVGTGVGRCAWEAVYSADSLSSKPSSAASTLWSLALVLDDDWETASIAATNGSLKALREMNSL
jgi:hypothetical protein